MKLGYSIMLLEHVEADEVVHGDCRDFQIVCPHCKEAIFKVHRAKKGSHYFAHYSSTRSNVEECELRVAQIGEHRRQNAENENCKSRGQLLHKFQNFFAESIFKDTRKRHNADPNGYLEDMRNLRKATGRSAFREYARYLRPIIQRMVQTQEGLDIFMGKTVYDQKDHIMSGVNKDNKPIVTSFFWSERQRKYAQEYVHHLAAAGSIQTLYDALAIGLGRASFVKNPKVTTDEIAMEESAVKILAWGSNSNVQKLLKISRQRIINRDGQEAYVSEIIDKLAIECIRNSLLIFPYVPAVMNNNERECDSKNKKAV